MHLPTMNPLSTNRAEAPLTLERRLERLCDALHELPDTGRRSTDHQATRILLSIDDMVGRVRALATLLEEDRSNRWDLVDHTAGQMLLRDLAIIARDLRAVAALALEDLTAAETRLRDLNERVPQLESEIEARERELIDAVTPDVQ